MPKSVHPLTRFVVLLLCGALAACDGAKPVANPAPAPANNSASASAAVAGEVLVSAAASTKELMEALSTSYSQDAAVTIKVNAGPSSGLANQIIEGAPADLFLSASREWATKVQEAGVAERAKELLTNKLVLIVPKGNPAQVKTPQDLLSDQVKKISLAGEKVPAGKYADQALTKLGLVEKLTADQKIARAQDVRGALSFVERGEAEAGIVYSTDVKVAPNVEVVHEFDPALHDEIVYVLVLLKHGAKNPAAVSFFEYLEADRAEPIYSQAGFSRIK
ncbi:molybdate ABC transporter substrate-binding protein [Anatilimnocola floriformis]|uniref:molybdate ABC transporter substrate-binding protein n=1 Tax=Anatilimnocola floriformis TaxID=2948575 RepID=UPI0020C29B8A|nr:molybdate ABC transporter substrate-binding protein [Anatilimnocola floriformis]